MGYVISPTGTSHRKRANREYIAVMNPELKKRLKLGRFCCVTHLIKNNNKKFSGEYMNLRIAAKVITDKKVRMNEILLDQSIRNAIGAEASADGLKNNNIRIVRLKTRLGYKLKNLIVHDRKLLVRVRISKAIDMEKDYCTIDEKMTKILGTIEGKKLNIYNCTSEIRNSVFAEDSEKNLIEIIKNSKEDFSSMTREQKMSEIAKMEHQLTTKYTLNKFSIQSFFTTPDSINDNGKSMYGTIPDFKSIANVKKDVGIILLDGEYRNKYLLDILDCVKIERNLFDVLKEEFIEFGIIFILTIFTAIIAINSSTKWSIISSIGISVVFTAFVIMIRNRK